MHLRRRKRAVRGGAGFAAVELLVALCIGILIVVGCIGFLAYMLRVSDDNRDKTFATLEVQYVGFWISEDVVQAQTVDLGTASGFPLRINWVEGMRNGANNTVIYSVQSMPGGTDLWELKREHVRVVGLDTVSSGNATVGRYLDATVTECHRNEYVDLEHPGNSISALELRVAASVDRSSANSTYEIHPRAFCVWTLGGAAP